MIRCISATHKLAAYSYDLLTPKHVYLILIKYKVKLWLTVHMSPFCQNVILRVQTTLGNGLINNQKKFQQQQLHYLSVKTAFVLFRFAVHIRIIITSFLIAPCNIYPYVCKFWLRNYLLYIQSLRTLHCNRSIASSKARSPQNLIQCFFFQISVPSLFQKLI
jgi:hypothetical protein